MMPVTEKLIHEFKEGDVVDVRFGWKRGKIIKYEIDQPKETMRPAAYFQVQIGGEIF